MRASIYEFMKVGIVHFKAFPEVVNGTGPVVETLRRIAEDDFFTAVEVGWIKDIKQRTEAAHLLKIAHMEVCYACQPAIFSQKLNLNSFDPGERKRAIKQVFNCLKEASDLGASAVRIPAGKDPGPEKREEAKKLLVDSLAQICEYAKEMGDPAITLKIFDRDIDKESLIGHFRDAFDIAKELRPSYPKFGLLADLSHFPLLREKPEEALPLVKDYVMAFHIGNCVMKDRRHPLYGDLQPRFGVEDGEIDTKDVSAYFRLLANMGLIGPEKRPVLSAEVRPLLPGETSELILANAKRVIKEAWALA
ncbi:sugar phosphate isomerase/epimerase family protein [Neomoorella humiferrea]|jgi:sugar phosphate isomerase/epimerase|uniref:Xylose isomerase-like TIM barrel n=1 Tax=Neomoorella humiferrea TaxID=676965 RepID=A0A2T0ARS8_9FIRM|nr:TIM barrel protein [Moorella humiferrea]PRR72506.1 Xylose isomerase-like TIM barrel [Moorella humiferrea]